MTSTGRIRDDRAAPRELKAALEAYTEITRPYDRELGWQRLLRALRHAPPCGIEPECGIEPPP